MLSSSNKDNALFFFTLILCCPTLLLYMHAVHELKAHCSTCCSTSPAWFPWSLTGMIFGSENSFPTAKKEDAKAVVKTRTFSLSARRSVGRAARTSRLGQAVTNSQSKQCCNDLHAS